MQKTMNLKVAEAIQDDVNKGIVRIDSGIMHEIGVRAGDIVELKGGRDTGKGPPECLQAESPWKGCDEGRHNRHGGNKEEKDNNGREPIL